MFHPKLADSQIPRFHHFRRKCGGEKDSSGTSVDSIHVLPMSRRVTTTMMGRHHWFESMQQMKKRLCLDIDTVATLPVQKKLNAAPLSVPPLFPYGSREYYLTHVSNLFIVITGKTSLARRLVSIILK